MEGLFLWLSVLHHLERPNRDAMTRLVMVKRCRQIKHLYKSEPKNIGDNRLID